MTRDLKSLESLFLVFLSFRESNKINQNFLDGRNNPIIFSENNSSEHSTEILFNNNFIQLKVTKKIVE